VARGRLFRSPLLTFGSVQPRGVGCEWTLGLAPIGGREVAPGDVVELHVLVEASTRVLDASSRVRFDVVAAGEAMAARGEVVARLVGTGAEAGVDAAAPEPRTTTFRPLGPGETPAAAAVAFTAAHATDLTEQLLILEEGEDELKRFHVLTWWAARAPVDGRPPRVHFRVDVDGELAAETEEPLAVGAAPVGDRTVTLRLLREDESPLDGAEFEVVLERGQRVRGRTDAQGTATFELPAATSESFRLFLRSYEERRPGVPEPVPPEPVPPEPRPPDPRPPADRRPEVVAAFAFDSAFPSPAVHAALVRVQAKAAELPDTRLMVFGHTDKVGSVAYNVALSERRAQSVLALLLDDRERFDAVAAAEGWDVAEHQSMLRGIGCNPGAIDGVVGALTLAATAAFQGEYNLGVYHELAAVQHERLVLPPDGSLNPVTRAAIRDAYVAVAPHVRPGRFADPPFAGCGKSHHIADRDDENRRAVVAFLSADLDLSQSSPCERYRELVGETPADRRAPHFSDHQWLEEERGAIHLSSAAVVPDGTPARLRIVRCEGRLPVPLPDSSGGGEPPTLGPLLAEIPAEIRGGVCAGRWTSPEPGILDPGSWVVDHDVQVEIMEPGDHEAPAAGDPGSGAALLAADGLHPPVFVVRAGDKWGVSSPPGQRLNRVRFTDDADRAGIGVSADGVVLPFAVTGGEVERENEQPVFGLVLADADVKGAAAAVSAPGAPRPAPAPDPAPPPIQPVAAAALATLRSANQAARLALLRALREEQRASYALIDAALPSTTAHSAFVTVRDNVLQDVGSALDAAAGLLARPDAADRAAEVQTKLEQAQLWLFFLPPYAQLAALIRAAEHDRLVTAVQVECAREADAYARAFSLVARGGASDLQFARDHAVEQAENTRRLLETLKSAIEAGAEAGKTAERVEHVLDIPIEFAAGRVLPPWALAATLAADRSGFYLSHKHHFDVVLPNAQTLIAELGWLEVNAPVTRRHILHAMYGALALESVKGVSAADVAFIVGRTLYLLAKKQSPVTWDVAAKAAALATTIVLALRSPQFAVHGLDRLAQRTRDAALRAIGGPSDPHRVLERLREQVDTPLTQEEALDLLLELTNPEVAGHLAILADAATAMAPPVAAIVADVTGTGVATVATIRTGLALNYPLLPPAP
jgi:outer membrane protein OmpA-like peptidoglycan-associated protein